MAPLFRNRYTSKRIVGNAQKLRLLSFFEQGILSDVTIRTDDNKEFPAHKIILASHSLFFEKMFTSVMQEAKTNIVHLKEMSSEIIDIILRFMYSGVVEKAPELFSEIYAAADRYDVQDLMDWIVVYVNRNIRPDNATKILKMSIQYSLKDTELKTRKFIADNEESMIKEKEYSTYLMEMLRVDNIVEYLRLMKKYKLADLKKTLIKFIADNFKQVLELQEYRELYGDDQWADFIIEIDRYISGLIEERHSYTSNLEDINNMSDLIDVKCNIE